MTATATRTTPAVPQRSFTRDLAAMAGRSLRQARREPLVLVPQLFVPLFFFAVLVGSLELVAGHLGLSDFRAFQLPVAVVIAVTGISRAISVVTDINSGYFDRLILTPANKFALLLGFMVADVISIVLVTLCVVGLGYALGVRPVTGAGGVAVIVGIAALWAVAYSGILYAVAFKSASATIMTQAFMIFFPFVFLTTTVVPRALMTSWMSAIAMVNPLTYVLASLRGLISTGWQPGALGECLIAIAAVAVPAHLMAILALRGRASRK